MQVLNDLHEFGFRPDLSRCALDSRVYKNGDNIARFNKVERVVNDVNAMMNANKRLSISNLTKAGLTTLNLYHTASFSSFHLAEYLFALTSLLYRDDTNTIMLDALRALYHAQGAWSGNDVAQVIQMVGTSFFIFFVFLIRIIYSMMYHISYFSHKFTSTHLIGA